jgi:hypothetical protein
MINCIKYLIYIRICQASEKLYKASNNKSLLPNFGQVIFNMLDGAATKDYYFFIWIHDQAFSRTACVVQQISSSGPKPKEWRTPSYHFSRYPHSLCLIVGKKCIDVLNTSMVL